MSARERRWLVAVLAAGLGAHLALLFGSRSIHFDLGSWKVTQQGLAQHGLHVYSAVDVHLFRWPYPPLMFVWIGISQGLDTLLGGHGFFYLVRLPAIAADLTIAWVVHEMLRRRGAASAARLTAAGAVAIGPIFIGTAAHQGQIDSVAILPVVLALAAWERGGPRRALAAGLLIGLGAGIKTVPLLALVGLLPSARSWREAGTLVSCALALPLLMLAPFLVADAHGVVYALRYSGVPGLGGLSLLAQPDYPIYWLSHGPYGPNAVILALYKTPWILAAGLLALLAVMVRRRTPPLQALVLVWLTVYVLSFNFFLQYLVWGIPFFLLYGAVRKVVALELALAPAIVVAYLAEAPRTLVWTFYTAPLIAAWAAFAVSLFRASRAGGNTRASLPAPRPSRPG